MLLYYNMDTPSRKFKSVASWVLLGEGSIIRPNLSCKDIYIAIGSIPNFDDYLVCPSTVVLRDYCWFVVNRNLSKSEIAPVVVP